MFINIFTNNYAIFSFVLFTSSIIVQLAETSIKSQTFTCFSQISIFSTFTQLFEILIQEVNYKIAKIRIIFFVFLK